MTPPVLRSGTVVLRPLTIADAEALFVAHGDREVHHFWSGPAFTSAAQTREKIAEWLARDTVETWAITQNDGDALGRITLMHHRDGVAEIGVILRRDAQGRGLAGAALRRMETYGFGESDLHRLFADADPDNVACIALFERAGFVREGLLRGNWKTHLGVRDSVILGKMRDD